MQPISIRTGVTAVVLMSLVVRSDASAQNVMTDADAAFQKQDWSAAAAGYERAVARDSTKGVWWFRLGVSYQSSGKFEQAIRAFEHAERSGFQPVADRYRIARLYSRLGKTESSLNALDSAITLAGGGVSPKQLTGEPDFDNVRNEARFAKAVARVEAARYPCRSMPEAHQLDFWVGEWDVTPWNAVATASQPPGYNDIHPILENCVVLENWRGVGGEGKSFNFFDTNIRKWRQVWMGDGGGPLDYTGEFRDGAMRFAGWNLGPDGKRLEQKLTFTPISKDTVRQTFESSRDGGKTWTTGFDARYVRRK
jgi:hypothetical protein